MNNNFNTNYIILYTDDKNIINHIFNKFNIRIILLLLKNEEKKIINGNNGNNMLSEIYYDDYIEENLIENSLCIIYLSQIKRSNILIECLKKYNKPIFSYNNILDENIVSFHNNVFILDKINNIILEELEIFFQNKCIDNNNNNNNDNNNDNNIIKFENLYNNLNPINKRKINKNINIDINKIYKNYENEKLYIVTYFKKTDNISLKTIQKKCIVENINNKDVYKIFIIGDNLEKELSDIYNIENIEIEKKKIILYNYEDNVTFKDLVNIINSFFKDNIICLLRCDILLPNQHNLNSINIDIDINNINNINNDINNRIEKKEVYSLSRLDRLINGNMLKSDKLNNLLFSTEQDAWIFRTPLYINNDTLNIISNKNFYDAHSELYFNKFLKLNNYEIINNTKKYKIIRLMTDMNIYNRQIIDKNPKINNDMCNITNNNTINNINNFDDIYLLPSNDIIDNISIEQLIKLCNINDKEMYIIKCDLFNKFLKNKIMNSIL
jgi:hypothetical protein